MSTAPDNAVYNSRTAGMLTPFPSRQVRLLLVLPILLLGVSASGQNWAGAEEQLAAKIVAVTGTRTMTVEISNRTPAGSSGLGTTTADDFGRGLLTQLAGRGVRLVSAEQASARVRVSLSENLQNYLWVAEIQLAGPVPDKSTNETATETSVVMVSIPLPEMRSAEPEAAAMVLHKTLLWSQAERILDVESLEGSPARMLILDSGSVVLYRLQDGRWQAEQTLPITHSRPWPRDLRGRLVLRKDHLFDAYLPGVLCRSTTASPLAMACSDSEEAWPIGTTLFNLSASFVSGRNYFSGAILQNSGQQMSTVPFYAAAGVPRSESTSWLLTAVDGQVHLLNGSADQVIGKPGWGSDIASLRSSCGSGWQVLATGDGDGQNDTARAFEMSASTPVAASAALDVSGNITALWTESGEASALAIAHNFATGRYEAFRISVSCSR
jgi:hypothetical protein